MSDTRGINEMHPQEDQMIHHHLPAIHLGLHGLSPLHYVYPGQMQLAPFMINDMFLAGFSDCAEEAVRYLVEVEGLSQNHPMVVGLKQYLFDKQRILELNIMLQNNFQLTPSEPNQFRNSEPVTKGGLHEHTVHSNISTEQVHSSFENSTKEQEPVSQLHKPDSLGSNNCDPASIIPEGTEQLVSDLVDEIYSLLQEEDDMYLDSDSEVDEGFDELTEQEVSL